MERQERHNRRVSCRSNGTQTIHEQRLNTPAQEDHR